MPSESAYITMREAAKIIGVTPVAFYSIAKREGIKTWLISGLMRTTEDEIKKYIARPKRRLTRYPEPPPKGYYGVMQISRILKGWPSWVTRLHKSKRLKYALFKGRRVSNMDHIRDYLKITKASVRSRVVLPDVIS
jgi:hypothetical protein